MKIHYLQHVSYEGLGSIEAYFQKKGYPLTATHLYEGQTLPTVQDFDWLIIMGGEMGIYDEGIYPWLNDEKRFITEAIASGKTVLGICLGAQLIADVLGATIHKNPYREIGWFPIRRPSEAETTPLSLAFPDEVEVFHWHEDTFDLPEGAISIAESEACKNQGFVMDDRIVGLQFHLETTYASAQTFIQHGEEELDDSPFVQTGNEMLSQNERFTQINQIMHAVLEVMERHTHVAA